MTFIFIGLVYLTFNFICVCMREKQAIKIEMRDFTMIIFFALDGLRDHIDC